jgi:integrase
MSRRGTIKQEDGGTWGFVVDIAPLGAPRRQVRRRGFRTKREAQAELTKLLHGLGEGTFVAPDRLTVAEYMESWLAGLQVAGKRATTISSYRERLKLHVLPRLGAARLQALTSLDLDRLYAGLLANGRRDGKGGLSAASVRYTHAIIGKALNDARRKKLIAYNPAQDATAPSAKSARAPEMQSWTPAELRTFLDSVAEDDLHPLFRLAGMAGMRRGEVLGLHRDDLDLDAGRVRVRRQLVSVDHVPTLVEHAKSDHGHRTLDLDPETIAVLRRHLARQATIRLAIGPG